MVAKLIDGKVVAASIEARVKEEAELLKAQYGIIPGLATVLIGENPASKTYVGMKQKKCAELAMNSVGVRLPASPLPERLFQIDHALDL